MFCFIDSSVLGIDEGTNQSVDSDSLSTKPEPDNEDSNMSFPGMDISQQDSEFKYGKYLAVLSFLQIVNEVKVNTLI